MNKYLINKNNYDKFIFKGSLALESYYDDTHENKELFDGLNNRLKEYRSLYEKTDSDKESIVNNLLSTLEQIVKEKFVIYEDGDVEYKYIKDRDFSVKWNGIEPDKSELSKLEDLKPSRLYDILTISLKKNHIFSFTSFNIISRSSIVCSFVRPSFINLSYEKSASFLFFNSSIKELFSTPWSCK